MNPLALLWWLLVGHALCDYPLQNDFLARAKNHTKPVVAPNGQVFPPWIALWSHALIHGGAVASITGRVDLGVAETILHARIDYLTCEGRTGGYIGDQAMHVVAKRAWVILAAWLAR